MLSNTQRQNCKAEIPLANPAASDPPANRSPEWPGAGDDLRPISAIFPADALSRLSPKGEILWANNVFWAFFDRQPMARKRLKLAALIGRTGAQQMLAGLGAKLAADQIG